MKGQTSIPVPKQDYKPGPCVWCGEPSTTLLTLEADRYGTVQGKRLLVKRAIKAYACAEHAGILDRQPRFYTCGCRETEGEDRCLMHPRNGLKRLPSQ